MEKEMDTITVYWVYVGIREKKLETTTKNVPLQSRQPNGRAIPKLSETAHSSQALFVTGLQGHRGLEGVSWAATVREEPPRP